MFRLGDRWAASDPLRRRLRRLTLAERIEEARGFINLFHRENDLPDATRLARARDVVASLRRSGSYSHTPDELAFGARVAWRNHARCIGRLYWKSLEVVDCRAITNPDSMAACIFDQLRNAARDGDVRPMISIFAPVEGDQLPAWVESRQAIQYAGYVLPDGSLCGDPDAIETTRTAVALGWKPPEPKGMFDVLPLILRDADGRRRLYPLPADAVAEVAITHPDFPAIAALGLRWYTVPCVSDCIMTIGGIDYPCAPFNGFYMATEIASRDFIDETRYNLLVPVAAALGLNFSDPLWRDRVVLELNRAVLYSYAQAGVRILDHHTASRQYLDFVRLEEAAGRAVSGDWAWIVPPQASSACPVFHLPMTDHQDVPNFYRSRASDGGALALSRVTEQRSRLLRRYHRERRRFRDWRRRYG